MGNTYRKREKVPKKTVSVMLREAVYNDARHKVMISKVCDDAVSAALREIYNADGIPLPEYLKVEPS